MHNPRKPNDSLNVDASVGAYLSDCLDNTDVLVLVAGDGDYFHPLISYIKKSIPIFCVGDPDKISSILGDIATIIDIQDLKPFIAETTVEE